MNARTPIPLYVGTSNKKAQILHPNSRILYHFDGLELMIPQKSTGMRARLIHRYNNARKLWASRYQRLTHRCT